MRGQGEGERGGLVGERKQGREREGKINLAAQPMFPHKGGRGRGKLSSPRQSYPAFAAPAQQECNLRVFSPSQLSLHKEKKKKKIKHVQEMGRETQTREISLPSNHVWGCGVALSVLFPGHSKAPTVLIIPIT